MLRGEGVTHSFDGLMAVSEVDFHVDQGEIVGLIGPNGAGKTTLFNVISGALTPDAGAITLKGEDITRLKPHQINRRGLARTFQITKLFPEMTAFENVRLALLYGNPERTIDRREAKREVTQLMASVGLLSDRNKPAMDLPLATQRRVEIARALATNPQILLLDEVMAGLTQSELRQAMQLVTQLRDRGITVFMIEHVMPAIMGVCDRIIVLHYGKVVAEGSPDEVANDRTVHEIYLGR
jgi:branched-chain amino acid transport system ATP-binding protein